MSYVVLAIVLFILFRFVTRFVIPVYRTTSKIRRGFRDMQEKMNNQQQQQSNETGKRQPQKPPVGDYIEFEEIK